MERQRFRRFRGAKQLLKGGKVMNELVWLAPIAAVAALVFALILVFLLITLVVFALILHAKHLLPLC